MLKYAGLALIATAAVTITASCNWDSRADSAPRELHRVTTVPVEFQPGYRVDREFAGEVQAGQSSRLGFEFAGEVAELYVDIGDAVTAGQALARLDARLLQSERDELQARQAELQAELETAQRNLARIERLQAESLASERELDDLIGRTRVLQASLQRVDAALLANAVRLEKSVLKAPFAAVVAERAIDSGAVVAPGAPVFGLVQAAVREVHIGVPDALAAALERGDTVAVKAGEASADGTVLGLGPVVDQATRSRVVRIGIDEDWAPGELAYVSLGVPVDTSGAWLPDTAVTAGARGTWVVYATVDQGDGEALLEARSVVIHHARGNRLFVSGAVNPGDSVVAAGLHRLAPGQRVRTAALQQFAAAH